MRRLISTLSLGLMAATASAAPQTPVPPPNIAGLWAFEADLNEVCSFNGQARLARSEKPDEFECELTARQACPSLGITYVVEQSCHAVVESGTVTVESKIETFLEGEPTANYTPDHFRLTIEDASTLRGVLIGADIYPAEWRRANGAIS